MRQGLQFAVMAAGIAMYAAIAAGQSAVERSPEPAHLDLLLEIAATADDGTPSVLRVTLTNSGGVPIYMPMPGLECAPGRGEIQIHMNWYPVSSDGPPDPRWSFGCLNYDKRSLMERLRANWIRLKPGEFIVRSENVRERVASMGPGTVDMSAEYVPPEATAAELAELNKANIAIPREKIETVRETFTVKHAPAPIPVNK
jgi:hypothetical protein